ncbi:A-kinase anchor protein 7-like isoform X2 [Corythoichthys intestinalis]|uniref:A-kinase anchor protein 7-like isoform X2 n=1 Tax=Corythoichthys intestinalis TaxID=161448 RepID=UPI0025A5D594|nr:A-kinase anchor protein 7-like isoform X2 [Corythoichthys intestinalis]
MHLSRLLLRLKLTCSIAPVATKNLLFNEQTRIKTQQLFFQASGLCQVTMELDSISQDNRTSVSAFDNITRNGEKEEGASQVEVDLERVLELENMKELQNQVEIGASDKSVTKQESGKKNRKRGRRVDAEQDGENTKKKKKQIQRPNYFVSIPITNAQISSAVTEVQESVLERDPRLSRAMIPIPTLHLTLLVTYLANQEQVDLAAAALAQVEPSLVNLLRGAELVLPFSGVAHFRNDVVFVALREGPHTQVLRKLAELVCGGFEERGLLEGDARGFEPHLTIMKLSRAPKLRSQGIKRVDPSLYSNYTSRFFGDQTVERLDLCSMLKKKQQDGYYHTETSLQLGGRRRSEPDEAELTRISKRLVEDAINRAVQQYKQETLQNGGGPAAGGQPPGNANGTTDSAK